MKLEIYIGKTLYGFCNGYFGRDSYDDKKIVYVGDNYIVAENENGYPETAIFEGMKESEVHELISDWLIKDEY